MNNNKPQNQNDEQLNQDDENNEISLWALLIMLARNKGIIFIFIIVAGIASSIYVMQMTPIFTASTRVLPPQQGQSSASAMLGQLGALAGAAGVKSPSELYIGLIKSRTVSDAVIRHFDLMAYYETKFGDDARKQFEGNMTAISGKDGIIAIEFSDKSPILAAKIANAIVEELGNLNGKIAVTEAAKRRMYFEGQFGKAKNNLARAEVMLKSTQEKTGLIQPEAQTKATIEAMARLQGEIAAKEVELVAMRAFATKSNPDYIRSQQEVLGMRDQLTKLTSSKVGGTGILMHANDMPGNGLEYIRKLRDVKYYEAIFELMAKQFEMAKADEAKDGALIQVIDAAYPPEHRAKPKRGLIVIMSMVMASFLGVLFAFVHEAWLRAKQDQSQMENINELKRALAFK